jgi:hypothetical protein
LNKYYSFTNPFGVEWTIWYLRESYTAMLCANLPLIYPLIQRALNLNNWSYGSRGTGTIRGSSGALGTLSVMKSSAPKSKSPSGESGSGIIRRAESQEWINSGASENLQIYQQTEFSVTSAVELHVIESPKTETSIETKNIQRRSDE